MRGLSGRLNGAWMVLMIVVAACSGGDGTTDPGSTTGSLSLTISGLPSGTPASITVSGAGGFSRSVTATETLSGLAPGSYTVTAASVTASDGRYAAAPASQTVSVAASTTPAAAAVSYALATGSMTVTVSGLPAGANAAVTVTGPAAFSRTVTSTTTISALEPGSYTVASADVTTADDRFAPAVPNVQVTVAAGPTPVAASAAYALVTGRLTITVSGLPAGFGTPPIGAANAAITVTGPGGYNRVVIATTQLGQLAPGAYTITASQVSVAGGFAYRASQPSQTVSVVATTTPATATVAYAAVDGILTITVSGLPQGTNASIIVTGPGGFNHGVTATTTLTGLAPGAYTITASNLNVGASIYAADPATQVANVAVGTSSASTVTYSSPIALKLTPVVSGLSRPVQMVAPPGDPRLFVVEQEGRIRIVQNGQVLPQAFLDIATRVLSVTDFDDEHGLLGLAFHPQYATNGTFFVFYMDQSQDIVVERYTVSANPNVANATGTLVLKVQHRLSKSHNGGGMAFGPDGFLYVSLGDGGCCGDPQNNAQNLNTLLGKVIRLDVSTTPYAIPPSNPFVGQAGKMGEIWAYGLRNPWRFDFDATTSVLYIADVGEDDVEEVDAVPVSQAGPNFGWSAWRGRTASRGGALRGLHGPGRRVPPQRRLLDHRRLRVSRHADSRVARPLSSIRTGARASCGASSS